jgi:YfiH family protein
MKESDCRVKALANAGLGEMEPRLLRQVHGTEIHEAGLEAASIPEADGWISNHADVAICVYIADCLPIFVWDREGSAFGVFHAGWRGLALGMARNAARAFQRYGLAPDRLGAAVGPHIGPCCYEIGQEVAEKFNPKALRKDPSGRKLLDLGEAARLDLMQEGVPPEHIAVSDDCTSCRREDFFSYRRDKIGGRMMAFFAKSKHVH